MKRGRRYLGMSSAAPVGARRSSPIFGVKGGEVGGVGLCSTRKKPTPLDHAQAYSIFILNIPGRNSVGGAESNSCVVAGATADMVSLAPIVHAILHCMGDLEADEEVHTSNVLVVHAFEDIAGGCKDEVHDAVLKHAEQGHRLQLRLRRKHDEQPHQELHQYLLHRVVRPFLLGMQIVVAGVIPRRFGLVP